MAEESIASLRKPGSPRYERAENANRTIVEYIGLTSTLEAAEPDVGVTWGEYEGTVVSTNFTPTEKADYSDLVVTVEISTQSDESSTGEVESEHYERDWQAVDRSMFEHPQFAIGQGGANELTASDIFNLERWEAGEDKDIKSEYKYIVSGSPEEYELSTNAKLFARGIQLDQRTYEDFAPIARKTSVYVGGAPPVSEVGTKDEPDGFPGLPSGYEWRKSTDKSESQGSRFRWERTEEWLGAIKVLSDKNAVYWEVPS